jgi:predicted GNAT superfamily acetyltransferase
VTNQWDQVEDVDEMHALLEASDRAAAGKDGFVPVRRRCTSARLVQEGAVWGLHREGRLVVSVTVDEKPTFKSNELLSETSRALYMRRLCVAPDLGDPLLGLRAVRFVTKYARAKGYKVVRAEANPDLAAVYSLLRSVGFEQCGATKRHGPAATAQLELVL